MISRLFPGPMRPLRAGTACVALLSACGQGPAQSPQAISDPRDLGGMWMPTAASAQLEVVGEMPELTPAGREAFQETSALKRSIDAAVSDPHDLSNCTLSGVPRIWGQPYPIEIVHQAGLTVFLHEHMHSFRFVYMNEPPPDPEDVLALHRFGHSLGRWEDDVLVVESNAFNGKSVLDESGLPSSEQLRTVERIRKLDDDSLEIATTLEDPQYYARPWTVRAVLERRADMRFREFTCGYGVYETRYDTRNGPPRDVAPTGGPLIAQ